jgi:hypothetical protein
MTKPDPLVDQLADQMVSAALQEIRSTLGEIHPNELTPLEMVALLTVLRPIRVRIEADRAPLAQLTLLRPKSMRQTRKPVRT